MLEPTALASEIMALGLAPDRALALAAFLTEHPLSHDPQQAWMKISKEFLTPADPFDVHLRLYKRCYGEHCLTHSPGPAWMPDAAAVARSNIADVLRQQALPDYAALHRWSIENREAYWGMILHRLGIRFHTAPERILEGRDPLSPRWLPGATLNIVESCFNAPDSATAIVQSNGRSPSRAVSSQELRALVGQWSNSFAVFGISAGDAVAIVAPMTLDTVAAYLAVIANGAAVISVAESFSSQEIAVRFRIARPRLIVTQDSVTWGSKRLPLYEKVAAAAGAVPVVVIATDPQTPLTLRPGDRRDRSFLSGPASLHCAPRRPSDTINILFSSGTTGDPKAIPWDQTTPLKCAADAHFHQDIHPGDVLCWPTSLGWMMGPWLIFAALLNRATLALHAQSPQDGDFGQFVSDARVTMLGGVPSLFRAWRRSDCMRGLDWSAIRCFSSSGECSTPADMLYLMHLAGYRPIIEYCGGTEIGGAYLTSTVVQPNVPGMFTTPALGIDLEILDEHDAPASSGEAFLIGPSIGLSTRLLNRDHDQVYYAGTPHSAAGRPLRRHGDELQRTSGGLFRIAGRCDDTMNLGGIKVGCAEIERLLNALPGMLETAAVAVPPAGGGPARLVVFVVPRDHSLTPEQLVPAMRQEIRHKLNPLFHLDSVHIVAALPRTASNKVMRRELRTMLSRD